MNRRKKAVGLLGLLLMTAVLFTGCGQSGSGSENAKDSAQTDAGTNMVEIKKDGIISNTTEEEFDEELYGDEEMLRDFILRNATTYNGQLGEELIAVKKLEVKKGRVTMVIEYGSGEAFSTLHGYPFFYGTVAEAYAQGYDLDVELYEAGTGEAGAASINREQLLEMGSRKIIITQLLPKEYLTIRTGGKILYIRGAECVKSDVAEIGTAEEGSERETAYIVFK